MNIFGLLKSDENTDLTIIGNEYLRLLKCYEFVLQESTDTDVRSIVEDKYRTVKNFEGQSPQPNPGTYEVEKGLQPAYLEALAALDSYNNMTSFNDAIVALGEAYKQEPNSVMNRYLVAAANEVIKCIEANPGVK